MMMQMNEMRSRLLTVADNLDVSLAAPASRRGEHDGGRGDGAPRRAAGAPVRPRRRRRAPNRRRRTRIDHRHAGDAETRAPPSPRPGEGDDLVDPRYEDLWASTDTAVDPPDLAALDVNFDDEPGSG